MMVFENNVLIISVRISENTEEISIIAAVRIPNWNY